MSKVHEPAVPRAGVVLPLVRRAAAQLRGTPDRGALAATLNEFMHLLPALRAAWVELPATGRATEETRPPPVFSDDALTLPLRTGGEVAGVLRHRLEGPVDGDRLRMLGAIADLLGAILERTHGSSVATEAQALLSLLAEHLPFGVACFSPTGVVLAANAAAREFAGGSDALMPVLVPAHLRAAGPSGTPVMHVARVGDRAAWVHVHAGATGEKPTGAVALVFDLGQRSREFLRAVARETYRALWLGRPLSLAVLSAPDHPRELLEVAEAIRLRLPAAAESGPLETDAVAVLAPETNLAALRTIMRGTAGLDLVPDLRIGLAELERDHRAPENFITAAVGALGPYARLRRPSLLLCDTSPSVTEALLVALRGECDAVRCHDRSAGWRLLGKQSFDAIFSKIELDEWDTDIGFLRRALELQPGLKAFVVTDVPGLYSATIPSLPAGTPVFRKPFQVAAVRHAVRELLAPRAGAV